MSETTTGSAGNTNAGLPSDAKAASGHDRGTHRPAAADAPAGARVVPTHVPRRPYRPGATRPLSGSAATPARRFLESRRSPRAQHTDERSTRALPDLDRKSTRLNS